MENLYPLEVLHAGADAIELARVMTKNVRLSSKNVSILAAEIRSLQTDISGVRAENVKLLEALTRAMEVIGEDRAELRTHWEEQARNET